jgi:8-oxo-dGTP diphosphatase
MPHIHIPGIDFTVEAFIVCDGRVLLRMHDKYDIWLSIGGHIEIDEDPVEALHREVMEEVGLVVEILSETVAPFDESFYELPRPFALGRHRISEEHEHVTLVYLARTTSHVISPATGEPESDTRWLSEEEVREDPYLTPDVRRYCLAALDAAKKADN